MIPRTLKPVLQKLTTQYPVVTVTGPRQSGKTTLCRDAFNNKPYVNLESANVREFARSDPRSFLASYSNGAILDKIQRAPQLLNLQSLGNDVGISHTTARNRLTLLEASFVVFLLRPWHTNLSKRQIKSPKLYFYDVGAASTLTNANSLI